MVEQYEVNSSTLAIVPIDSSTSRVIEYDAEFIVKKDTTAIIDHSCKFFGSSYQGRFEGTKSVLGVNDMNPVSWTNRNEVFICLN